VNGNNSVYVVYNRFALAFLLVLQRRPTNTTRDIVSATTLFVSIRLNSRFQSTLTPNLLNELRFQYSKDF